jgi:2-methylfumaryl-CoA isomerase
VSVSGRDRLRYGNSLYGSFGRDFVTKDGRRLMIVAITRRQWSGLIDVLGLRDAIATLEQRHGKNFEKDEGARFIHREELFALVQQRIGQTQFADLAEAFDRHAVCWGEYRSVHEALEKDARLSPANPMFDRVSHPSGATYLAAGFPGVMPAAERRPVRPAPKLGADTDEILATELGLPEGEIGRLHDVGIVAGPRDL